MKNTVKISSATLFNADCLHVLSQTPDDELAAFDEDIEKEGSPTFLGDKRIEGSVWPKSIRGSTPKLKGVCQIERASSESGHLMRFHIQCPHCGGEQYLKWGGKEEPYGFKWENHDAKTVFYLCEHSGCVIDQNDLDYTGARYICDNTGIYTEDGLSWFASDGEEIDPPDAVSFHIWTAYSPFTTWVQIVKDYFKTKGDPGKLKTFTNTTLGETWSEEVGKRPMPELLHSWGEVYVAQVPLRVVYLTAGIDSQLDRYEMRVWGWAPGEEAYLIDRQIIMGRHDEEATLRRVDAAIAGQYLSESGDMMSIARICWDTGGIDPDIVYTQANKETAEASAKSKATPMKRNGRKMSLSMPGRPSLLPITAECRVNTAGFGVREDHAWLTESVTFSLGTGGMTMDFSLATDIKPQGKKGGKDKKSGPDYFS